MIGDIPFATVRPPENILFVCKLNPVTADDDLELIFSRFGKILSCEVVRDKKSGDSLQYAFIEFDERESAEQVCRHPSQFEGPQLILSAIRRTSRCKTSSSTIGESVSWNEINGPDASYSRIWVDFSQSVAKMNVSTLSSGRGRGRARGGPGRGGGRGAPVSSGYGGRAGLEASGRYRDHDESEKGRRHGGDGYGMVFEDVGKGRERSRSPRRDEKQGRHKERGRSRSRSRERRDNGRRGDGDRHRAERDGRDRDRERDRERERDRDRDRRR